MPSKQVRYVKTGNYPYGAAILPDGKTGLVSNETPGTVSVIDLEAGTKVKDIQVGSHLSHPEAIAVDPKADRAYVAVANADQVAVIDTEKLAVARTLSVGAAGGRRHVARRPQRDARRRATCSWPRRAPTSSRCSSCRREARAGARRPRAPRRAVLAHEAPRPQRATRRPGDGGGGGRRARGGRRRAAPVPADYALVGRIPVGSYPADVEASPRAANACTPSASSGATATKRRPSAGSPSAPRCCAKLL